MNLQNKTVFITGATRGIGRAVAIAYQATGAKVVGTGTKASSDIKLNGYFQANFNDPEQLHACADYVRSVQPDVLVNNAGTNQNQAFMDIDTQEFLRIQRVNVLAPLKLCQAALPHMMAKKWGRIVNISSIWGKISKENRASYSASKFALDGMTTALAIEHATAGILANCISPGFTDTELTHKMLGEEGISQIIKMIPIRRMATTEEIAQFVIWLGGPKNTYITGQNIAIDGGFTRA